MTYLDYLLKHLCPRAINKDFIDWDYKTIICNNGITLGCRLMTCEQCWRSEIKECEE